ncbi:MAG: SusD/RagB family nutrient-binding outer membrane lipoprotein, partial [Chitinophagaceae bacterium]
LDTMSRVETTFWLRGSLDGDDVNWHYVQPFISYADVCFMMSEIALGGGTMRSINGHTTAKDWYDAGIRASMDFYVKVANLSGMLKLTERTADMKDKLIVDTYISGYATTQWGKDPKEALFTQAWIHLYKHPEEMWGYWKMYGSSADFPAGKNLEAWEPAYNVNGQGLRILRRAMLARPTSTGLANNDENWNKAIINMQEITGGQYLNGLADFTRPYVPSGRIYWDKK